MSKKPKLSRHISGLNKIKAFYAEKDKKLEQKLSMMRAEHARQRKLIREGIEELKRDGILSKDD